MNCQIERRVTKANNVAIMTYEYIVMRCPVA